MADEEKGQRGRLRPEPPEKGPEPIYANYVLVNHTPWDFMFHFGNFFIPPEVPKEPAEYEFEVKSVARITVPTTLIKGIVRALQTNIETYESIHGVLPDGRLEEKEEKG